MSDVENLRDTVIPKSDQINADDLIGGATLTITVSAVRRGDSDQPIAINFDGDNGKPYKPGKSMRRVLIHAWSDDGRAWVGKSMTLYCDPDVKFGGVKVGGIRISHMSDIPRTLDIALTTTRGKRSPYTVKPLVVAATATYPEAEFNELFSRMKTAIENGKSDSGQVIAHCEKTHPLTEAQINQINAVKPLQETY